MKKLLSNKKVWIAVGAIIILSIGYSAGSSGASTDVEGEKMKYGELQSKIAVLETEQKDAEETLVDISIKVKEEQAKLDEKKDEVAEVFEILENKNKAIAEISRLEDQVFSLESKISGLEVTIAVKEDELHIIEGNIISASGSPIELLSGVYVVGSDIPSGRYQATNVGRGSNFFVYNSSGLNKVNTILGDGIVGSGDYVFFANEGDIIETNAKVRLIPVD